MRTHPSMQQGFSMIEIIVTLLIIATALLGSAGLQAYAMKTNIGSQYRNQAAFLLEDMIERMETNKAYSVNSAYDTALSTTTDCAASNCDAATLAAYDVTQWEAAISAVLPSGTGTVTQTQAGNMTTHTPSIYKVEIDWVDRKTSTTYASAVPTTEPFSIVTNRTIGE